MTSLLKFLVLPIFYVIGFLFVNTYKLLFGWWLEPLSGRKSNARLAEEIENKLSFLFSEHGARIVPNEGRLRRGMDFAYTTIEVGNFRLHFITGRGDLAVRIAPKHAPSDWHDLALVVMALDTPQGLRARENLNWLEDVARVLRENWERLNFAMSERDYPVIRNRLNAIYDLPTDDLSRAGIRIPRHRSGTLFKGI
jgi:hypothetical protein